MFFTIGNFINKQIAVSLFSLLFVFEIIFGCGEKKTVFVEEGRKEVNGTELYYKIIGNGEPIVVLHGGPGFEHTYLLPQMEELADRFKLIFYDQRASGGSMANIDSASITLENFVDDLEGIRKVFDLGKMNLMGHSWGGLLAIFYAIEYPQNTNSLMLLNTAGARSDFWEDLYRNIDRNRTLEDSLTMSNLKGSEDFKNKEIAAWEKYLKIFFKPYFYNQNLADSLSMKFTKTTLKNLRLINSSPLGKYIDNFDILDQLSVIECPTLIIHGETDPIPVKYSEEIHNRLDNSDLVILEQCGHFPYIEMPDKLFGLISNFMEEISN